MHYVELYRKVYSNKKFVRCIKYLSYLSVAVTVAAFAGVLIHLACNDLLDALKFSASAFVPFMLVSLARYAINNKRPYEYFDFNGNGIQIPKLKKGNSFPSRHVFSAFLLGTLFLPLSVFIGVCVILIGVMLAVFRVLLGIHFVSDVICGAVLGILSGAVGVLFFVN